VCVPIVVLYGCACARVCLLCLCVLCLFVCVCVCVCVVFGVWVLTLDPSFPYASKTTL